MCPPWLLLFLLSTLAVSKRLLLYLKCRLVDVSSLVTAILTFHTHCIKDDPGDHGEQYDDEEDSCRDSHHVFGTIVQDYLQKLSCATELTIGNWFIEVMCMLQFKGVQIPEPKCKYLTLEELRLEKFNLFGVAGLLRALHHMETLYIDFATAKITFLEHPLFLLCSFYEGLTPSPEKIPDIVPYLCE
uniref:Uncharacterized protein n=1 Tax=Nicotiana tabacum TaxID=4097 RepID=A0A1S3XZ57_TOBAC|nr:PREDICTED: uncharacterized protein LOC107770436 [Nicotiana tabacum]